MRIQVYCCCLLLFALTPVVSAQDWPRFRGANGTGISSSKSIPVQWSDGDINWKIELPGEGHSSPVVWGERIFLTATRENPSAFVVFGIDAKAGKILWKKEYSFLPYPKHQYNSFASSTPAADAGRVYVTWSTPERYLLIAFDHDGNTLWEQDLGPFVGQHASGTSPIVAGDKVIVADDQDGPSCLFGLDAATGAIRWKIPRRNVQNGAAYATPCLREAGAQAKAELIFLSWPNGVTAVDPDTGQVTWSLANVFDKRCVSSPVIVSGLVVGSCGSGGGGNYVAAVRPPDPGQHRGAEVAYTIRKSAPYVPTAIALGDLLFLWSDSGIVTCADGPSGRIVWQERVGGNYFGSPVCVDGKVYNVSTTGEVVVVEASKDFKVLARNPLGELSRATPAVAGGRMYIRTSKHLYSIGGSRPEAAGR